MSRHINELAEIVLDRVYKMGWQHRSEVEEECKVAGELVAAERKLRETEQELDRLRQRHVEVQSEEVAAARAEIETLQGAMSADDKRLRDAEEKVWPGATFGCDAAEKMADEILYLRQQLANAQREAVNLQKLHDHLRPRLDAAQGQLTRERLDAEEQGRELERLRAFVELARGITPRNSYAGVEMLRAALDELDAGTAEPTPVAERCPECDESGMVDSGGFTPDGKGINVPCGGDCRGNKCPSEPTPVAEPIDAEGGA